MRVALLSFVLVCGVLTIFSGIVSGRNLLNIALYWGDSENWEAAVLLVGFLASAKLIGGVWVTVRAFGGLRTRRAERDDVRRPSCLLLGLGWYSGIVLSLLAVMDVSLLGSDSTLVATSLGVALVCVQIVTHGMTGLCMLGEGWRRGSAG